ncbi:hypothetical protein ACIPPT_04310 [Wolbachia endosymbiont of Drosophila bicornuta]
MLLLYHSHKHISYPIRTIARSAIVRILLPVVKISSSLLEDDRLL